MNENQTPSKYPHDDDIMKYDYNSHRYVLTKQGVREQLGENLDLILNATGDVDPTTLANRVLQQISQAVYLWIYEDSMGRDWLEYILATYPPLRDRVREMLQAQLLYALQNGFVSNWSGVNIAKGQIMDIDKLRGRAKIAPEVEQLANQFVSGLGYSLKYLGQLPCVPCELYHRGY